MADVQTGGGVPPDVESFGGWSRFFCVAGGIVAIGGGISLAGLRAASENNLFAAIANGIGWYCIGKGIFMMAIPFQAKGAVVRLLHRSFLSGGFGASKPALSTESTKASIASAPEVATLVKTLEERGYAVRQTGSSAWEIRSGTGTSYAQSAAELKRISEMLPDRGTPVAP